MKMPIDQRYECIRSTYNRLGKNMSLSMQILQVSKNTIYNAINITNPQPRIYELKLKEEHKTYIHAKTIENPHISGEELAHQLFEFFGLKVSDTTINNYRNKIMQFRQPIRSVYISEQSAEKRFLFTDYHLKNNTNFLNTVFTDESWFVLGRNSKWVWWIKPKLQIKFYKKKQAHAPKVMIWEGIAHGYKTDLIIIDGNVNTETYIDQIIFGSNMIETADKKFGIGHWTFMQDNARPHVSKETLAVLKELEIDVLPNWPPYSPDLNIIEVVWAIMEKRVEMRQPKTMDELINVIKDVWDNLTWQTINGLVNGITDRLKKVHENPRQTLNYYSILRDIEN